MAVQSLSSDVSSFPLRTIEKTCSVPATLPPPETAQENTLRARRPLPLRLEDVKSAVTKALVAPSETARVVRGDLQARGMWFQGAPVAGAAAVPGPTGAIGGAVGGLLAGAILGAGLITIGAMAREHHHPFESVGHHHGNWILASGAAFAPVLGAIMLGTNGALGGTPIGGAATGAALGLIVGAGMITIGALAREHHHPFESVGHTNGNWILGSGAGFSPLAGAILGSMVGVL
ncbi:MAG TPA: hypothetical protein VFH51_00545 [Myxococcota bacterium]|nr:hypothetical protein [Myxococcota bacterium]